MIFVMSGSQSIVRYHAFLGILKTENSEQSNEIITLKALAHTDSIASPAEKILLGEDRMEHIVEFANNNMIPSLTNDTIFRDVGILIYNRSSCLFDKTKVENLKCSTKMSPQNSVLTHPEVLVSPSFESTLMGEIYNGKYGKRW